MRVLHEREVEVLFGSRFPDDVTELQLVQQVNRVKMAMAEGRTIVLVNHDNIYEALYDVLNQRYIVKRDPRTGATRGTTLQLTRHACDSRLSSASLLGRWRLARTSVCPRARKERERKCK